MNLEETHSPDPHSSANWKSPCLSWWEKWVMTPSDIVSGEVEFTGCRVGGTHCEGPLLLTPSLSLKRFFVFCFSRHLQAPWWVDPRDSHLILRPAPWLSHSLQLNLLLSWEWPRYDPPKETVCLWCLAEQITVVYSQEQWGELLGKCKHVDVSNYSGEVQLKCWFKKRVPQSRTRLPCCLRRNWSGNKVSWLKVRSKLEWMEIGGSCVQTSKWIKTKDKTSRQNVERRYHKYDRQKWIF